MRTTARLADRKVRLKRKFPALRYDVARHSHPPEQVMLVSKTIESRQVCSRSELSFEMRPDGRAVVVAPTTGMVEAYKPHAKSSTCEKMHGDFWLKLRVSSDDSIDSTTTRLEMPVSK